MLFIWIRLYKTVRKFLLKSIYSLFSFNGLALLNNYYFYIFILIELLKRYDMIRMKLLQIKKIFKRNYKNNFNNFLYNVT